jgi:hypothetical protein
MAMATIGEKQTDDGIFGTPALGTRRATSRPEFR